MNTPAQIDRGTPETRKHKRRSTMERLIESKRIGGYELRAAQEIERVFLYITAGVGSRIMSYEERTSPSKSDHVPHWFMDAYHVRYKPWANDLGSRLILCTAVLIDGWSIRSIREAIRRDEFSVNEEYERELKQALQREKDVTRSFVDMLRDYCLRAGWPDKITTDEWARASTS
jgi:hypothetical protein